VSLFFIFEDLNGLSELGIPFLSFFGLLDARCVVAVGAHIVLFLLLSHIVDVFFEPVAVSRQLETVRWQLVNVLSDGLTLDTELHDFIDSFNAEVVHSASLQQKSL
jgi:hypothetical protein